MTQDTLQPQEQEMARKLWDMTFDGTTTPIEKTRAFSQASQKVREALYIASQQPQYRGLSKSNPFEN